MDIFIFVHVRVYSCTSVYVHLCSTQWGPFGSIPVRLSLMFHTPPTPLAHLVSCCGQCYCIAFYMYDFVYLQHENEICLV